MDWWAVLESFVGDVLAGAAVLYLGYRFIDSRLKLREREERRSEIEAEKTANRRGVLQAVLGELYSNAAQREHVVPILKSPDGVPFPLFDTALWNVLAQAPVLTTLGERTVSALIHAYNRMGSANEQCQFLADLSSGQTAILVHSSFAGRRRDAEVSEIYDQYKAFVAETRAALVARLDDLRPFLESAIDAVEAELGIEAPPAAQRTFLGVQPPADAAPLGRPRAVERH